MLLLLHSFYCALELVHFTFAEMLQESNTNTKQCAIEIETKQNLWEFLYKMFAGCFFLAASSFFPLSCSSMCMYEEVWMELVGCGGERKGLKTHYMMVKIPINKSNPNFNGFECAFFFFLAQAHPRRFHYTPYKRVERTQKKVAIRWMFHVIYYSTCTLLLWNPVFGFAIQEMILFNSPPPSCVFSPMPSSMNHPSPSNRQPLPHVASFFYFFLTFISQARWMVVNTIRIFCMNVFHFSNIVIELDGSFSLSSHSHRQEEVLMSVERKTRTTTTTEQRKNTRKKR